MAAQEGEKKSRRTQQHTNKDNRFTGQQSEVKFQTIDPERYRLNPNQLHFITDYIYDLFRVTYTKPLRRICVSFISGLTCYFIGIIIAMSIGFTKTYITSPVVYLLTLLSIIVMDRLRWAKGPFTDHLNEARDALIIDDDHYVAELNNFIRKINNKRPIFFIYLITLTFWLSIIAIKYMSPNSILGRYFNILIPDTMPALWFVGPHLLIKMILAMWQVVIPVFNFAYAVYIPATVVPGWHRLVMKWPVIPVPSFISSRFNSFINFYFYIAASYAIAVLVFVLAYGGKFEPPLIIMASLFAILGLLCMLFPLYTTYQLVNRARNQIGSVVLRRYFRHVYPLAGGNTSVRVDTPNEESIDIYHELNNLQELMNNANEGSEHIYPLNLIVPVILSQAIPFLGFLYPLIFPR